MPDRDPIRSLRQELRITAGASADELLFDKDGALIDARTACLTTPESTPHPLLPHFHDFAAQFPGAVGDVFTLPGAGIPVVSDVSVIQAFASRGMLAQLPSFSLAGERMAYRLPIHGLRIGILTAGGIAPGLNDVIDSLVRRHYGLAGWPGLPEEEVPVEIRGYEGGYGGLIRREHHRLRPSVTQPHSGTGGSMLNMVRETFPAAYVAEAIRGERLDVLYVIGGDGTFRYADHVCEELENANGGPITGLAGLPVRVVGAPKTMDNDLSYTDVTFGFRSVLDEAAEFIRRIHLEVKTCRRLGIMELFGAGSGFVAQHAATAAGVADYVLLPEMLAEPDAPDCATRRAAVMQEVTDVLQQRLIQNKHALLVVAEGASRHFGEHGGRIARDKAFHSMVAEIARGLGQEPDDVLVSRPRHLIRSIRPNTYDIELCKDTGRLMVDTALAGYSRCGVQRWEGRYCTVPFHLSASKRKKANLGAYFTARMTQGRPVPAV